MPEFKGDGCTMWFDGVWRACCDAHDFAYTYGANKILADLDLATCVAKTGHGAMGLVMLAGVTIGGWYWWHRK